MGKSTVSVQDTLRDIQNSNEGSQALQDFAEAMRETDKSSEESIGFWFHGTTLSLSPCLYEARRHSLSIVCTTLCICRGPAFSVIQDTASPLLNYKSRTKYIANQSQLI